MNTIHDAPAAGSFTPFLVDRNMMGRLTDALVYASGDCRYGFLDKLCAIHRINTLAGLFAANHGWLGASFSAVEILSVLYHLRIGDPALPGAGRDLVVLSKGHAAMAQYAILAACGLFPIGKLLEYKTIRGLPAHCDRSVPGVDTDSGSLGQGLSKALGLSLARRRAGVSHHCYVLLGDGELQEGQVFESLLTHARLGLSGCIPIIDRNFLQSDSRCAEIKDAHDWNGLFSGIGLRVFTCDGHSVRSLDQTLKAAAECGRPAIVIAETVKGYGTSLTGMTPQTERRRGVWHARIPDRGEYLAMAAELVERLGDSDITNAFAAWRREHAPQSARETPAEPATAVTATSRPTAAGFVAALQDAMPRRKMLFVLDADLEKSCRLTDIALGSPDRFIEVGISEQDMASIAAGIALGGGVAVVNTYAAFHKRALDQLFAISAEGLPVIVAGHYAGIDYHTDGKSHQSLNDIGLIRALGGFDVYEPLTPEDAGNLLAILLDRYADDRVASRRSVPAYLRLHRTPLPDQLPKPSEEAPLRWRRWRFDGTGAGSESGRIRLFSSDPHLVSMALEWVAGCPESVAGRYEVIGFLDYADPDGEIARLARSASRAIVLESHFPAGGPAEWLAARAGAPVARFGPLRPAGSARTLAEMLRAHGMTLDALEGLLKPGT
ncbi:MAG TPA: hypothetical protein PLU72_03110 [Candidatus Ozemobacteraceae bacterium]|nr:hypothetical protein [Candidatus Ozemobacteraceae bacterium]HQG27138.1 hypothetical protein [Candidatus Ozemobacteraceae bacterium]